jgi:Sporulation and spore germination
VRRLPSPVLVVLLAVMGLAAGCGLKSDERPQPIPRERLDESLFREGADGPSGGRWARIYVISSQERVPHLVHVDLQIAGSQDYDRAVIEALISWVPPTDRGGNLRLSSLIPYGTTLREVRRDGEGVLTVDLANLTIEGPGQAQALAQIVYTATAITGIDYVRFAIDGKPVAVPLDERSASPGARLSRRDFAALDPELATPTTTTTAEPDASAGPPSTAAATLGAGPAEVPTSP